MPRYEWDEIDEQAEKEARAIRHKNSATPDKRRRNSEDKKEEDENWLRRL